MGISHSWNGTVLTITSDSGTSSADLKGDMGIRGPQGATPTPAQIGAASADHKHESLLDSICTYYGSGKDANELTVGNALIPISSASNAELWTLLGTNFAYVQTYFFSKQATDANRMQIASGYGTANQRMAYRNYNGGTWSNWKIISTEFYKDTYSGCFVRDVDGVREWLNPPNVVGTEYRTTERWNNKIVYTKIINFGLSANAKTIELTGITSLLRYSGQVGNYTTPYFNDSFINPSTAYFNATNTFAKLWCGANYLDKQSYLQIWYTKD